MSKEFAFTDLDSADLIKGAMYRGGDANNLSAEPISKLLPVGNQSGIRFCGSSEDPALVVLYTTFKDKDWPDAIEDNLVTYFGDNKTPGQEIHQSVGNIVLRTIFNIYYLSDKKKYPPIFLFSKGSHGFDRKFEGILKPGSSNLERDRGSGCYLENHARKKISKL